MGPANILYVPDVPVDSLVRHPDEILKIVRILYADHPEMLLAIAEFRGGSPDVDVLSYCILGSPQPVPRTHVFSDRSLAYCMCIPRSFGGAPPDASRRASARARHTENQKFFSEFSDQQSISIEITYCMHGVIQSLLLCANFRDAHRTSRMLGELQRFSLTIAELFAMGPVSLEIFLMRANFYKIFLEIARSQNMIFDIQ